jgi:two-component system OmpR family response regulator
MHMAHILVVDDDKSVADMVVDALSLTGHQSTAVADGYAALNVLRAESIDLVISDVNMPKMNGFELLERVRKQGNDIPFLLLTARDQRQDVATGLRTGADDYVTKPFGLEELTLRVQALLRRAGKLERAGQNLTCGPLTVDLDSFEVRKNGELISLSTTEFKLLTELLKANGKVVTKTALLDRIWGYGYYTGATVLDTYISYLRKKVHDDDWQGIKTVRGTGFKIVDDEKQ